MRHAGPAALLLFAGASCASVQEASPVARAARQDSHFRLVETESSTPVAVTSSRTTPPAVTNNSAAKSADEILPVAWQNEPPPAPLPASESTTSPADVAAPSAPLDGLTLDGAIGMALAANPTLAQADYAVRRSQGEWTQTGLYPNPIAGYMASEIGQEDQIGQQGVYAQQTFVTGDKLELNRAVASGDIAAARAELDAQRLRVIADTQSRFYQALGARRLVEIAEKTQRNAELGLDATRQLEEAGESTRADVLLAEAVFERSGVSTQEAQARDRAAWRQLAVMMGRAELEPMPLSGELETDRRANEFESVWFRLKSSSPELRRASARIARARARIGREQAQTIPNVDAQLGVQQDAVTNYTIGFAQIGVMLPVHHRNQGAIAAAQADYCREIKEYERLELNLRDRLAEAVRDAEVAAQQAETYGGKVVPAAEEGLSLVREGYVRGEFDVLRLLTAQQTYADAQRDYVRAQTDLQLALARLDGLLLTGGLDEPVPPQGIGTPETLTDVPKAQ